MNVPRCNSSLFYCNCCNFSCVAIFFAISLIAAIGIYFKYHTGSTEIACSVFSIFATVSLILYFLFYFYKSKNLPISSAESPSSQILTQAASNESNHEEESDSITAPKPNQENENADLNFIGTEALKQKQKSHLEKLEALANQNLWQHIQSHTEHEDSGFDWWMLPIDRDSAQYEGLYHVSKEDVAALKEDSEFMQNYRKGVKLIALSWGWDLENIKDVTDDVRYWTNYQVRLGKMLNSLLLFGETKLHANLVFFVDLHQLRDTLEPWIVKYL